MSERNKPAVDKIMQSALASASIFGVFGKEPNTPPPVSIEHMTELAMRATRDLRSLGLNDCDRLTLGTLILAGQMHELIPARNWRKFTDSLPAMLLRACALLSGGKR